METYHHIDEELVKLSNGEIKKVRSLLAPVITIVCIALGILIILYGQYFASKFGYRIKPAVIYLTSGALILGSLLWLWISSHYFVYLPSKSRIKKWSRYFDNSEVKALKELFNNEQFDQLPNLLYAKDSDGSDGTSVIRIEIRGTKKGEIAFAQVIQYIKYNPTPVSPVKMFTGNDAKQIIQIAEKITQY